MTVRTGSPRFLVPGRVGWNDDPFGSGHKFRPMGRQICIAQEGSEGVVEFGHVQGSEFVLWDDGVRTEGLLVEGARRPGQPLDQRGRRCS